MVVIVGGRRWVQGGRAETAFLLVVEGAKPLHLLRRSRNLPPRSGISCRAAAFRSPASGAAASSENPPHPPLPKEGARGSARRSGGSQPPRSGIPPSSAGQRKRQHLVNTLGTEGQHQQAVDPQRHAGAVGQAVSEGCQQPFVGGAWLAPRDTRMAVIAAGYGDGYPRSVESGTPVLVNGHRAPLIGRVSMDMITVDVTDLPGVAAGDPVVLWGEGVPVEEIARCAGTIPYELICGVSQRVHHEMK